MLTRESKIYFHCVSLQLDDDESRLVHRTKFLAREYLRHAGTMSTGYLLPSLAVIFRIPAPPSLSSQFFPAYNAVQLFIRSSLSTALSAFLPPTALPSVRMIMPFHGDDPLLTRAYIASTLRHSHGTCTLAKRAHLKRNVYTFCH